MAPGKTAQLLHNPDAGDGLLGDKELTAMIVAEGFNCIYTSTQNDDWQLLPDADLVVVAGGDGTIKKAAVRMLERAERVVPIAILPMGTANNLSNALNITAGIEDLIASWQRWNVVVFDVATVSGAGKPVFFLESIGFGMFPYLLNKLRAKDRPEQSASDELKQVLKDTRKAARSYKGHKCILTIDGQKYKGKYLMIEVMNIPSIGANLVFNPQANVNDNMLEVITVARKRRSRLTRYLKSKVKEYNDDFNIKPLKGRNISIQWKGRYCHIDDEMVTLKKNSRISVAVQHAMLDFLV